MKINAALRQLCAGIICTRMSGTLHYNLTGEVTESGKSAEIAPCEFSHLPPKYMEVSHMLAICVPNASKEHCTSFTMYAHQVHACAHAYANFS